jgi:hypothetical protein
LFSSDVSDPVRADVVEETAVRPGPGKSSPYALMYFVFRRKKSTPYEVEAVTA